MNAVRDILFSLTVLLFVTPPSDGRVDPDDQLADGTTSALALSFPLHRLEPYCTCVWLDPLVIASGPDMPPMPALPMSDDDIAITVDVEAPNVVSHVQQPAAVKVTATYILASEPVETDRQNVADSQDGARILFTNPEAKNADKLLSADTFSFMRNDCSADKWVAIELSQRVKLIAVDISMLELYSSRVKTFDVYGSLKKPSKTAATPWHNGLWTHIATLKLENKKGQQAFYLQALSFSKFLLLHFTAHFGSEPICAINNFRAFGITEAEDLEEQLSALQGTEDINVHGSAAHVECVDAVPHEPPQMIEPAEISVAIAPSPHSVVRGAETSSGHGVPSEEMGEGHASQHQQHVPPHAAYALPNSTTDAANPKGPGGGRKRLQSGLEGVPAEPLRVVLQPDTMPPSAGSALDASMETDMQASTADGRSIPLSSGVVESRGGAAGVEAWQVAAGGAPKVLPHVFNEAVGVVMHGASGQPSFGASPKGSHGTHKADESRKSHLAAGSGTIVQKGVDPGATSAILPDVGAHDEQNRQGKKPWGSEAEVAHTPHTPATAVAAPAAGMHTQGVQQGIGDNSPNPAVDSPAPMGNGKGKCVDGGDASDRDRNKQSKAQEAAQKAKGAETKASKQTIPDGAASEDLRIDSGQSAEKKSKPHATIPHHDTTLQSKGSSASVYDLIKKELLALKVETSTLSMSMKQVAPQASVQEAVRKHAETEAKVAFVTDTLLALEARIDGFAEAHNDTHALCLLRLQVACGMMSLVMVLCLATGMYVVSSQLHRLQSTLKKVPPNRTSLDARRQVDQAEAGVIDVPPGKPHDFANVVMAVNQAVELSSQLCCADARHHRIRGRYERHRSSHCAGNSRRTSDCGTATTVLQRRHSEPHIQPGSVHVIFAPHG